MRVWVVEYSAHGDYWVDSVWSTHEAARARVESRRYPGVGFSPLVCDEDGFDVQAVETEAPTR